MGTGGRKGWGKRASSVVVPNPFLAAVSASRKKNGLPGFSASTKELSPLTFTSAQPVSNVCTLLRLYSLLSPHRILKSLKKKKITNTSSRAIPTSPSFATISIFSRGRVVALLKISRNFLKIVNTPGAEFPYLEDIFFFCALGTGTCIRGITTLCDIINVAGKRAARAARETFLRLEKALGENVIFRWRVIARGAARALRALAGIFLVRVKTHKVAHPPRHAGPGTVGEEARQRARGSTALLARASQRATKAW